MQEWEYDPEKFNYATDLVQHIRSTTGEYFSAQPVAQQSTPNCDIL